MSQPRTQMPRGVGLDANASSGWRGGKVQARASCAFVRT
jgi:hypothetical protein